MKVKKIALLTGALVSCLYTLHAEEQPWKFAASAGFTNSRWTGLKSIKKLGQEEFKDKKGDVKIFHPFFGARILVGYRWGFLGLHGSVDYQQDKGSISFSTAETGESQAEKKEDESKKKGASDRSISFVKNNIGFGTFADIYLWTSEDKDSYVSFSPGLKISTNFSSSLRLGKKEDESDDVKKEREKNEKDMKSGINSFNLSFEAHIDYEHSSGLLIGLWGNYGFLNNIKCGDTKSGDAKSGDAKSGDAKSGDAKSGDAKCNASQLREHLGLTENTSFKSITGGLSIGYNFAKLLT